MLPHGVHGESVANHAKAVGSIALGRVFQALLIVRLACKLNIVSAIVLSVEVMYCTFFSPLRL